ncbi:MAG: hypothetical protein EA402_12670 [Planctomycetota bacterium]|nr:MAG: hypothetical protein EA402_12670 [Planctomycetota bacterium]
MAGSVAGFVEPDPDLISPNPGGPEDPLGESILDHNCPPQRIFEPADVRLVIGRHQQLRREVLVEQALADGIPMHRRVSGGGAVVLAPGMLVIARRLPQQSLLGDACLCAIAHAVVQAIAACGGPPASVRGHGDVAVSDRAGRWRKVLGASLRQRQRHLYYLGVLLVEDGVPLMQRYLCPPSRQPEYRAGRDHASFCAALAPHGLRIPPLAAALGSYIGQLEGPSLSGSDFPDHCPA